MNEILPFVITWVEFEAVIMLSQVRVKQIKYDFTYM